MANDNLPVLTMDRLDYVEGAYEVAITRASKGTGMEVRHRVSGRNLVAHFLKESKASFAVEVSAPYATYREILRADDSGEAEAVQTVFWKSEDVVPPVYLRPMAIATVTEPIKVVLNGEHGVHEIWHEVEVEVEPGVILAADRFWRAASTWQSLIRLGSNDTLPAGVYRVDTNTADGFYFKVQMHPDLYRIMVNPGEDEHDHCQSILTGCLSRGLEMLREEYGEDERWQEYPVLKALHAKLVDNQLPTWDEPGFRADEVATRLKPIVFGSEEDG